MLLFCGHGLARMFGGRERWIECQDGMHGFSEGHFGCSDGSGDTRRHKSTLGKVKSPCSLCKPPKAAKERAKNRAQRTLRGKTSSSNSLRSAQRA